MSNSEKSSDTGHVIADVTYPEETTNGDTEEGQQFFPAAYGSGESCDNDVTSKTVVQADSSLQLNQTQAPVVNISEVAGGLVAFGDGNVYKEVHNVVHQHQHQHVHQHFTSNTVVNADSLAWKETEEVSASKPGNQEDPDLDIDDEQFVRTKEFDRALETLDKHEHVMLCGPPGSGKTALGRALLRHYRQNSFKPYIVQLGLSDWHSILSKGKQSIVLIDGTLGELHVNQKQYSKCQAFLNAKRLNRTAKCLLVLTAYPHILRQIGVVDAGSDNPLLETLDVVDLRREQLDVDTMTEMLNRHTKKISIDPLTRTTLVKQVLHKGTSRANFPWCCRQMVRKWTMQSSPSLSITKCPEPDPTKIFSSPAEACVPFLQRMLCSPDSCQTVAALLALTILGSGRFLHDPRHSQQDLERLGFKNVSQSCLEEYADILRGYILADDGDGFGSRDQYDAAGLALGRSFNLPVLLKVCDVRFFVQYVHTEDTASEFSITVGSKPADRQSMMERMYDFIVRGQLSQLCQHPAFSSPQFLREFAAFCASQPNYFDKVFNAVDPEHGKPLMYWSVWNPSTQLMRWYLQLSTGKTTSKSTSLGGILSAALACAYYKNFIEEADTRLEMFRQTRITMEHPAQRVCVRLPFPAQDECVSEEMKNLHFQLSQSPRSMRERYFYVENAKLPVTDDLLRVMIAEDDVVKVELASKEWKLVLRLLSDRKPDQTDERGNTMLHVAAELENVTSIRLAIQSGASLLAKNNREQTPPQLARERNDTAVEDSNITRSNSISLKTACEAGDLETVKVLLCQGVALQEEGRESPLFSACRANCPEIFALLVLLGAETKVKNNHGETLLEVACLLGYMDIVTLLFETDVDVNGKDRSGDTSLHHACWNGHNSAVLLLFKHGADVRATNRHGNTPLHNAAGKGHTATVQLLLENKADVKARNNEGMTPLHSAARNGHVEVVTLILQCATVDVNARVSADGDTPLLLACCQGATQLVRVLLDRHAAADTEHEHGHTPLHKTCRYGLTDIAQLLVEKGADVNAVNDYGDTPLFYASANGHVKTVKLLLKCKANINVKNKEGHTALFEACSSGNLETVALLLHNRADVKARSNKGRSLVEVAQRRSQTAFLDLLVKHGAKADQVQDTHSKRKWNLFSQRD